MLTSANICIGGWVVVLARFNKKHHTQEIREVVNEDI